MTAKHMMIWSAILAITAVLGSYGLACVLPFAAIAAIAAVTLPRNYAIAAVGATWAVNQIVGFALMNYAHDASTYAWGAIIAVGAFTAWGAAQRVKATALLSWRTALSLVAAVMAYQSVMFAGAVLLDGFESSTPAIVAQIVLTDIIWFAGLLASWMALGKLGLARPIGMHVA